MKKKHIVICAVCAAAYLGLCYLFRNAAVYRLYVIPDEGSRRGGRM